MRPPPMPPAWQVLAGRTDLRSPEQDRYGPAEVPATEGPHERDGLILYAREGGGTSAMCSCGWHRWHRQDDQAKTWGRDHAAPKKKGEGVTYDCPTLRKMAKSDEHR